MDYDGWQSLPAMFFDVAQERGASPFLWVKRQRQYQPLSWLDSAHRVDRLARGLIAFGVQPGDRIVLVAENRPEWVIADLAIMSIGAVTVPAYVTNTVEDHRHILGNSGARAAIVSTPALASRRSRRRRRYRVSVPSSRSTNPRKPLRPDWRCAPGTMC